MHIEVWGQPLSVSTGGQDTTRPSHLPSSWLAGLHTAERKQRWMSAAKTLADESKMLQVSVLGGSITGGCGAGTFEAGSVHSGSLKSARGNPCNISHSWGRLLAEELTLRLHTPRIRVELWGKSAIEPRFFTTCAERFHLANASIVLLELEPNAVAMRDARGVNAVAAVVRTVRRVAPEAAVAFVAWPPMPPEALAAFADVKVVVSPLSAETFEAKLRAALPALRLDAIFARAALDELGWRGVNRSVSRDGVGVNGSARGGPPASTRPAQPIPALFHADKAHPNGRGHELLGQLAAFAISRQLERARVDGLGGEASGHRGSASGGGEASDRLQTGMGPTKPTELTNPTQLTDEPEGSYERCYDASPYGSSPALPVVGARTMRGRAPGATTPTPMPQVRVARGEGSGEWTLVNHGSEGGGGGSKWGYESVIALPQGAPTKLPDAPTLLIGPLAINTRCTLLEVSRRL